MPSVPFTIRTPSLGYEERMAMAESKPKDAVILVIGLTGSGRSTFINALLGKEVMAVGQTMSTCTRDFQVEAIDCFPGYLIVDTPGLGDSIDTLLRIARWLQDGQRILGGVIYLHDISRDRNIPQHLEDLRSMCGNIPFNKIVIGTTRWEKIPPESHIGANHEQELRQEYWKSMIDKGTQLRRFDNTHESARAFIDQIIRKDIVIFVMGPTGVGKSTFVNKILGKEHMVVGHALTACTNDFQVASTDPPPNYAHLKGRRLVVVDTPGFDNPYREDRLRRIVDWLKYSYPDKDVLCGVIYLHDISNDRLIDRPLNILEIFRHFCRDFRLNKIVLGTTKWKRVSPEVGEEREREVKEVHWKNLTNKGSPVCRFDNDHKSAWNFIDLITRKDIVIPILGEIGVGKSTFANAVLDEGRMAIGEELTPCTVDLQAATIDSVLGNQGYRLIIVDTPGFNASVEPDSDSKILEYIIKWLKKSYGSEMVLGGIIYLLGKRNQTQSGILNAENLLQTFHRNFVGAASSGVSLGTTKWPKPVGKGVELLTWTFLLLHHESVVRGGNHKSPRGVADTILQDVLSATDLPS